MDTLRNRFIVSHILPVVLITPLMGIVLIFVLESQVILVNLSAQLSGQAAVVVNIAGDYPQIWSDMEQAQAFVDRFNRDLAAQLMLLQPDGLLLAAGIHPEAEPMGQILAHPGLPRVRAGLSSVAVNHSQELGAEVVDMLAPVFGPDRQVVGVVRLTHELATVYQRFQRVRSVVAWVLIPGLLLGIVLGFWLTMTLERPLYRLAAAIGQMTDSTQPAMLSAEGPREIRLVAHTFNTVTLRLQSLEMARRNLLETLVHELGRPLGALRSAIQALQRGAADDLALRQDLLAGMEAEVQRLRRLLEDLSHLYDHAVSTARLQRRHVSLHDWFVEILAPWQQAAEQKGLTWRTVIAGPLPVAHVDPDRLGQALGNLLSNAVKYTPPGGTIVVHTNAGSHAGNQAVSFAVRDSGPGIPPEERHLIFTPFYRGKTNDRMARGAGLGLAIARDLVVAHGGRIEVASAPGTGSQFILWLPVPDTVREETHNTPCPPAA